MRTGPGRTRRLPSRKLTEQLFLDWKCLDVRCEVLDFFSVLCIIGDSSTHFN